MTDNIKIVRSLDRALQIIDVMYSNGNEMGITEISKEMSMYQSTIYRALITLEKRGFVYQNKENSKYGLGLKLYAIGMKVGNNLPLISIIKPYIKDLLYEVQETINVCILDSADEEIPECILLYQESPSGRMLGITQIIGEKSECYYSAAGKILLAFLDKDYSNKFDTINFINYTKNTIIDADKLKEEIIKSKAQGFAIDNEEREQQSYCIACPILDRNNNAVASISISGPKDRVLDKGLYNVVNLLKDVCTKISKLL